MVSLCLADFRIPGCWRVMDVNRKALAYVHGQEDSGAGSQHLTVEVARRIAVNIARLPELVRRSD